MTVAAGVPLGYVALMERLRKWFSRHDLVDGALAGGIAALGVVEVWVYDEFDGSRLPMTVVAIAAGLVLLPRRTRPVPVMVASCALLAIGAAAWNFVDVAASPFASLLVAIYSTAAFGSQRTAFAGLGIGWAAFAILPPLTGDSVPIGDVIWVGSIMSAVWGAGWLVHARHETAVAMADRAALAEREREERARAAVAEERSRIARELHDVVAHSISVMVVQAGGERRALGEDRPETREVLSTIEQTGRQTLAEMRRLLGMLRRSDDEIELAPQPGMAHVDTLVEQVREAGLPVTLNVEGDAAPLPAGVDLSAYRIVQEALTNALKHAGPASARVTVRYADDELVLDIVDDGEGAVNGDGGGHGLIGMRERAAMFGGELAAGERSEGGYAVRARLPITR
jgi:signal transduction histidine kinase